MEFLPQPRQFGRVDAHPGSFHVGQHRDQRRLQMTEQFPCTFFVQHRIEYLTQLPGDVRIFARVFLESLRIDHPDIFLASHHFRVAHRTVVEVLLGKDIHPVAGFGVDQVMRHHRVEQRPEYPDTVPGQHLDVKFEVLSALPDRGVFEHLPKAFQGLFRPLRLAVQTHPVGLPLFQRKGHPDDPGVESLERSGFRIESKLFRLLEPSDQRLEFGRFADLHVSVRRLDQPGKSSEQVPGGPLRIGEHVELSGRRSPRVGRGVFLRCR